MFEGMDIGTLFVMKGAQNNAVHRVKIQSALGAEGPSITLEDESGVETERTVAWIKENMDPAI